MLEGLKKLLKNLFQIPVFKIKTNYTHEFCFGQIDGDEICFTTRFRWYADLKEESVDKRMMNFNSQLESQKILVKKKSKVRRSNILPKKNHENS